MAYDSKKREREVDIDISARACNRNNKDVYEFHSKVTPLACFK